MQDGNRNDKEKITKYNNVKGVGAKVKGGGPGTSRTGEGRELKLLPRQGKIIIIVDDIKKSFTLTVRKRQQERGGDAPWM